jgi:hypothetical protein
MCLSFDSVFFTCHLLLQCPDSRAATVNRAQEGDDGHPSHKPSAVFTMDVAEFRKFARAAVDYVADYLENIRDRWVLAQPYIFLRILMWDLFIRY